MRSYNNPDGCYCKYDYDCGSYDCNYNTGQCESKSAAAYFADTWWGWFMLSLLMAFFVITIILAIVACKLKKKIVK